MADIRISSEFMDDFERPNEDPIQPPWTFAGFSATTAALSSGGFQGHPGDTQYRFMAPGGGPYNLGSDTVDVWGQPGPGVDLTEALRIGFFTTGGSGYMLIIINGLGPVVWNIRQYTSGGNTTIQSVEHNFPTGYPNDLVLVKVVGGVLSTYYSSDLGDNWEGPINSVSVGGSGMYMFLGTSSDDGGNPSWRGFGGMKERWVPQIYRRPNE